MTGSRQCPHRHRHRHFTSSATSSSALQSPAITATHCWNCSSPLSAKPSSPSSTVSPSPFLQDPLIPFCPECHTLQPAPNLHENKVNSIHNYFTLFHVSPSFSLPRSQIDATYKQYAKLLHPDRYVKKSVEEQQHSSDWSSLVNAAYSTLRDPYQRAVYLLSLSGIEWEKQPSSLSSDDELMHVMELREEIDDAVNQKQYEKLHHLLRENERKMHHVEQELQELLHPQVTSSNNDNEHHEHHHRRRAVKLSEDQLSTALPLVAKLAYMKQIHDAIHKDTPAR